MSGDFAASAFLLLLDFISHLKENQLFVLSLSEGKWSGLFEI
jgi:hypothetical protein